MSIDINVSDWKAVMDSVKAYRSDATITIADGKARIMEVDDTKTNMIYAEIPCEGEGTFSVDLEKFSKALSAAGKDSALDLDNIEEGFLRIEGTARIKFPLINKDGTVKWPEKFMKSIAACDMSPAQLDPVLSYAQFCSQGVIRFVIGDTRMNIQIGEEPNLSEITSLSTATGESESGFSLPLIQTIIKLTKGLEAVTVEGFGNDMPMTFSWVNGNAAVRVLVAPRIEDDL